MKFRVSSSIFSFMLSERSLSPYNKSNRGAVFEATTYLILPLLCHKSATACQVDSYVVSKSKLKPDLNNCVNTEMTESTAPPHSHKNGAQLFLGHPVATENTHV